MMHEHFPEGYIPSKIQAMNLPEGTLSDAQVVDKLAVTWNPDDVPPVADYKSLRPWLEEKAEYRRMLFNAGRYRNWYDLYDWEKIFIASQGSSPSCAGFSLDRARQICLMNQIFEGSEQTVERANPGVAWALSKGSVRGGQTLQAMALTGNQTGSYPESKTAKYDAGTGYGTYANLAEKCPSSGQSQIGFSQVPDSYDFAEEIVLACQAGCGVMVGNLKSVDGFTQTNGKWEPVITSGGAHATAFGGYDFATEQADWWNSWGKIYETHLPPIGGPMSKDSIKRFMNSSYADLIIIYHAEASADSALPPTLEL